MINTKAKLADVWMEIGIFFLLVWEDSQPFVWLFRYWLGLVQDIRM